MLIFKILKKFKKKSIKIRFHKTSMRKKNYKTFNLQAKINTFLPNIL